MYKYVEKRYYEYTQWFNVIGYSDCMEYLSYPIKTVIKNDYNLCNH